MATFNQVNSRGVISVLVGWQLGSITVAWAKIQGSVRFGLSWVLGGAWLWQVVIVRYWISGVDSGRGMQHVLAAAWEFKCWAHHISHEAQF